MTDSDHEALKKQLREFIESEEKEVNKLKQELNSVQERLNQRLAKFEPANLLLKRLEGLVELASVIEQQTEISKTDFAKLTLAKAGIKVLRDMKRRLSSAQLVEEIRKRGKPMKSKHSVYMISQALKDVPDKVRRIKEGGTNYFEIKEEAK